MRKLLVAGVVLAMAICGLSMAPVEARAQTALDDAGLEKVLTAMGLQPKPLSHGFLVTVSKDKFTIPVQFVLSSDKTKLGLNANLGLVDEGKVSAAQWMALMAANEDIDPSAFYYDLKLKKLYLHRTVDNRSLTAPILRTQLDNFAANARSTAPLWSFTH
jgi:hypothetical protein